MASASRRPGQTDTASNSGGAAGAREQRGAARWGSLQSEPPQRRERRTARPHRAGAQARVARRDSGRISELTAHRDSASIQNDCKHHGAQPRRQYGARSRHPAHHDDAQRRSRRPARRRVPQSKGLLIPMETSPRAPASAHDSRPCRRWAAAAARRDEGSVAAAGPIPRRSDLRQRAKQLARSTQAPSSTRTTGPFTSSRRAFVRSSRPLGLVLMMWRNALARDPSAPKAITVRQAVMLAAVFEFAGAVLMGSNVAKTIRKGIAAGCCRGQSG